ncbi:MAG: hypothetical protein ACRD8W_16785, partial [Nitrososphaeraceae archaeon]
LVIGFIATAMVSSISMSAIAQELPNDVTWQKTQTSAQDPLPGHESHQAVIALPPRTDNSVWVGDTTWTASKPVEVVVLHGYNTSAVSNQTGSQFGVPLTAPFGDGEVAITLVKTDSGSPVNSGSMDFAGNALAFHTLGGEPFTVTYTVDATAEELDNAVAEEEDDEDEGG